MPRSGGWRKGRFASPRATTRRRKHRVSAQELSLVLWGIDPTSVKRQKRYALNAR